MMFSKIVIIHKLPHRMRLYFHHPDILSEKLKKFILKNPNIHSFEFSRISKSALVVFNPLKIESKDVIGRIVVGISLGEKCGVVNVHDHTKGVQLGSLMLSMMAVLFAKGMNINKNSLNKTFYLGAVFSLIHAVINHIIREGASTAQYRVMTLKNPDTNEEYYHAEIKRGGQITYMLSNLMGENENGIKSFNSQTAYEKV